MATLRVPLPDIDRVMPLPRPERSTPATSATAPGPARPAWAQSPRVARLLLWYVLLLIPTLFFKYSYLRSVATDGLSATLASGPFGHLPGVVQYLLLFKGDLLEVLVIVLVAAILGTLLRIDLSWLVAATSFLAIAVSAANWLSFETAGALIARDNLTLAVAWIRENPLVLLAEPSDRLLAMAGGLLIVLAALWSFSAFLLARYAVAGPRAGVVIRLVGPVVAVMWLAAGIAGASYGTHGGAHGGAHGAPIPESFRGYWSETLASLVGSDAWQPRAMRLPTVARLDSEYHAAVYPAGTTALPAPPVMPPLARARPAHIVIISLETAARRFYPITGNPAYPTFFAMGQHGITSDHHFTAMPATMWAIYAMVSGTYPRLGRSIVDYGDFHADGLASVLGQHGYETSFIDSYRIDWNPSNGGRHDSRLLRGLGFSNLIETPAAPDTTTTPEHGYVAAVARERRSLATAVDRVVAANAHGTKAFVFVATILGHYPWRTPPGTEGVPNAQRIPLLARDLDACVGEFLAALASHGLTDSVIVVVTGDHGLRTAAEFASVGERMQLGELSFNVPLLIYAPGLLSAPVQIPFVTSHIDLAPTLLAMTGIHDAPLLLEGGNMLDGTPCGRTTFLLNGTLRPVDGFYRDGQFFAFNRFTGDVRVTPGPPDPCSAPHAQRTTDAAAAANILGRASQLFDTTAAIFLRRDSGTADRAGVVDQGAVAGFAMQPLEDRILQRKP